MRARVEKVEVLGWNKLYTEQFKLEDCRFFNLDKFGQLKPLSKFASDEDIMLAGSETLKLDNQKNGWKVLCIHQHANGGEFMCVATVTSVRLLAEIGKYGYQHIGTTSKNFCDITDEDIQRNVKFAATEID